MKVEGRCHCGNITYSADVDPQKVSACHCRDCQVFSGSAFRVSVPVPRETFELKSGTPKIYVKTAESGTKRAQAFCPECGTPIYSSAVSDPPLYSLRVSGLDRRADLPPQRQIWCRSALPWTANVAQAQQFDKQQ